MSVREADDPVLFARIQQQNLLRQYDLLTNCVEIALAKGIEAFDKYTLWALNAAAVANIAQFGGRFRNQPIYVGNHIPPHFKDVPDLVDEFLSVIHENWTINTHPTVSSSVCVVASELDSSIHRRKRPQRTSSLLLAHVPPSRGAASRQEDRSRAYPREPSAVLRSATIRRPALGPWSLQRR